MTKPSKHQWTFRARFRRNAFGWKSQPAITRIREAVSEIKRVTRQDKVLAAEGAVLFLEKLSPAIERVDNSSGAIGSAVNKALKTLVDIIATAPADDAVRQQWLERLWQAYQEDDIPYIELLGDYWGELCASPNLASRWADELIGTARMAWSDKTSFGFFKGTTNCLSALLAARRYDELLELLALERHKMWHYRQYGAWALAAKGDAAGAIEYAEDGRSINDSEVAIARVCEDILLSAGKTEDAYERYGLQAGRAGTYTAWYRAVAKKYPAKQPKELLGDLMTQTPGEEGKWFAAAKDAKLYDEAIALAQTTPCAPQTLTRAARDFCEKLPDFAWSVGCCALHWLTRGYGYDITSTDVVDAYTYTMKAAENAGRRDDVLQYIRDLVANEPTGDRFVSRVLGARLEQAT